MEFNIKRTVHLNLIFAILVYSLFASVCACCAEEYRNARIIGAYGTKDGGLYYPCGVAVDSVGNIYATDWRNKKVTKYNLDGKFMLDFETKNKVYMRLKGPAGIAIDASDNIFVVDQYMAKVYKYNLQGKYLGSFGNYGTAPGKFLNPRGICVDAENNIFVADYDNFRVQKFSPKGDYISELKYMNESTRKYAKPRGVASDSSNNIYVVFSEINKVAVFSKEGKLVSDFGDSGALAGQFKNPRYIACDNLDNIYITDYDNHKVHKFNKSFKLIASFGAPGKKNDNFKSPEGIYADASGNVYVADALNDRISKWEPEDIVKHANWAALFEKKGMLNDAINEHLEILKIKPKDQNSMSALVELNLKSGNKARQSGDSQKARAFYQEVLKYDPLNEIAMRETNELSDGGREERDAKKQNMVLAIFVVLAILVSMIMTFKSS